MTVRLSPEHERALEELLASGRFGSMEEAVAQALTDFLSAPSMTKKPIWERIQEIRDSIDPHAFDSLPEDGASEVDHYIYGTPKRNE